MQALFDTSLELTRWLQTHYPGLLGFFKAVSSLGTEEFYFAILPLLYWCLDKRLGRQVAYVFMWAAFTNAFFKQMFFGPRPYWLDPSVFRVEELDYGVPSGHTQLVATFYGALALQIQRRWMTALAILLVVAMFFSRIYLGAHFLHDTTVGLLLAFIILFTFWAWQKWLAVRFNKLILGQKLVIATTPLLVFMLIWVLVRWFVQPNTAVAWASFIPQAQIELLNAIVRAFAAILGGTIGLVLESSWVRFKSEGSVGQKAARYVLGLVVLLAIWGGLKKIFPEDPLWLGESLRGVRYFLATLWMTYYAPYVFVKLKLAESEPIKPIDMKL